MLVNGVGVCASVVTFHYHSGTAKPSPVQMVMFPVLHPVLIMNLSSLPAKHGLQRIPPGPIGVTWLLFYGPSQFAVLLILIEDFFS